MISKQILDEIIKLFPNKSSSLSHDLKSHSGSLFYISHYMPDVIIYAETDNDIIQITDLCLKYKIPLIPYGSGTSVEGHISAVYGGVCLDLSRMNCVLEFKPDDEFILVQPGISYNELNEYLAPHGYHFPVEAGWGASIGGMLATNASGAGATDAGSMAKNVMCCEVVVCKNDRATKISVGSRTKKTSAGYNILSLFIGSEGTLGVVTKVGLKIRKDFQSNNTICSQFDDISNAIRFVVSMKGIVQFRRVELMDKLQTDACIEFSSIDCLVKNKITIIIELSGNPLSVQEDRKLLLNKMQQQKASNIVYFENKRDAEKIWMMRKNACNAAIRMIDKSKKAMATDVCVPLSELANCINNCYKYMEQVGIKAPLVAHIGDGNFHFSILVDPTNEDELQMAKDFNKRIIDEALKVGGTCTGEHGIGIGKMPYLLAEHGDSIFVMQLIKNSLDPNGIFNPGKVIKCRDNLNCWNESSATQDSTNHYRLLRSRI